MLPLSMSVFQDIILPCCFLDLFLLVEICVEERDALLVNDLLIDISSVSFYSLVPKPSKRFGSHMDSMLTDAVAGSCLLQYKERKTICYRFFFLAQ